MKPLIGEEKTMSAFVDELIASYRCPEWLSSGHANTIWAYSIKPAPRIEYRREGLETSDGDLIHLDWTEPTFDTESELPLVLGCHGLEGSANAPYIRRLMHQVGERGWGGVAMNYRGCSGRNRTALAYHAGFTQDLERVLEHIAELAPRRPLFIVGYSLGGSITANYLGSVGSSLIPNLRSAFLVSTPFNLEPGTHALRRGFNRVYEQKFLLTLRFKALMKGLEFPELRAQAMRAARVGSIRDFDNSWIAPVFGFDDAEDYYAKTSAANRLADIEIPVFALHAHDDPFIIPDCVPKTAFDSAKNVTLGVTERGGHVGFVCKDNPHWLEEQALKWVRMHLASGSV